MGGVTNAKTLKWQGTRDPPSPPAHTPWDWKREGGSDQPDGVRSLPVWRPQTEFQNLSTLAEMGGDKRRGATAMRKCPHLSCGCGSWLPALFLGWPEGFFKSL